MIPARGAPSPSVPPRGPTLHSGGSISLGQRLPPAQGEFSCPPACCAAIRQPQHLALLAAPRRSAGHVAGIGAALASYAPGKHPNHHPPALATHLNSFPKMSPEAWLPQPTRYLTGLSLLLALGKCRPEPCMRPAARGQRPAGGEAPSPNPASPFLPLGKGWGGGGMPKLLLAGWGAPRSGTIPGQIRASLLLQVPPRTGLVLHALQGERGISGFWLGVGGLWGACGRPSVWCWVPVCWGSRGLCALRAARPRSQERVSAALGPDRSGRRDAAPPGSAARPGLELLVGCFGFRGRRGNGESNAQRGCGEQGVVRQLLGLPGARNTAWAVSP